MITIEKSEYGRYCKLSGEISPDLETDLDDLLSCDKKGAEYSAAYQLGRWDGKIHMFKFDRYSKEYLFPYGALRNVRAILKLSDLEYKIIPTKKYPYELKPMNFEWKSDKELYDYQKNIIDKLIEIGCNGVVEMPTGAGKTLTALKFAQEMDLPFMVLVHRAELFDQWRGEIRDILGEEPIMIGDVVSSKKIRAAIKKHEKELVKQMSIEAKEKGLFFPKLKDYSYDADKIEIIDDPKKAKQAISTARCCIAMVQTLHSYMSDTKSGFGRLDIPVLIVDECHTCPADTVFDVIYRCSCKYALGLSATVGRSDGLEKKITAIIGPRVQSMNVESLVDKEILATPKFIMLYPEPPEYYLTRFTYASKPNYKTVYSDCIVTGMNRNEFIANVAAKFLLDGDHQIYIHVTKIHHGEILQNMIPNSVCVFGSTPDRKQIIQDYREGKIKCLISTLLKEGVSIPSIDVLIYAAGGKSEISTIQTIGRALRKKSDGRDAIIVDVYDAVDAYLLSHSRDRLKAYEKFYGKLFDPIYIKSVDALKNI